MLNKMGGSAGSVTLGIAFMLIAACSYAISGVFARKQSGDIPVEAISFGQMAAALCFILPAALIIEAPFKLPVLPTTYVSLLWLGLLGSCISTLVWYSLLHSVG